MHSRHSSSFSIKEERDRASRRWAKPYQVALVLQRIAVFQRLRRMLPLPPLVVQHLLLQLCHSLIPLALHAAVATSGQQLNVLFKHAATLDDTSSQQVNTGQHALQESCCTDHNTCALPLGPVARLHVLLDRVIALPTWMAAGGVGNPRGCMRGAASS